MNRLGHFPMRNIKITYRFLLDIVSIWNNANATSMGAAAAYYTIFAIAPLFILVLALAGLIFGQEAAHKELFGQLSKMLGHQGAEAVQSIIAAANKPKAGAFATGLALVTLFVGATTVFLQLQNSLNAIWEVKLKPGSGIKNFIKHRLLSFAMLLGIGFLLLVSLLLSAGVAAAGKYLSGIIPAQDIVWSGVDFVLSFGLILLLLAMIFKVLPDVDLAWRDVWVGAAITAMLFDLGKFILGYYLGRGSIASAYGAAGSLVVLLLWVYYSVQILLFGAAFTRVYANKCGSKVKPIRNTEFIGEQKDEQQRAA